MCWISTAASDSPGEDFDGDGNTDDVEALKIGTSATDPCGSGGWSSDLLGRVEREQAGRAGRLSFIAPVRRLDTSPGRRLRLRALGPTPGRGIPFPKSINVVDITTMLIQGTSDSPAYPADVRGVARVREGLSVWRRRRVASGLESVVSVVARPPIGAAFLGTVELTRTGGCCG